MSAQRGDTQSIQAEELQIIFNDPGSACSMTVILSSVHGYVYGQREVGGRGILCMLPSLSSYDSFT
eukprot:4576525-Pleurochrysis_carterae.AAC.1